MYTIEIKKTEEFFSQTKVLLSKWLAQDVDSDNFVINKIIENDTEALISDDYQAIRNANSIPEDLKNDLIKYLTSSLVGEKLIDFKNFFELAKMQYDCNKNGFTHVPHCFLNYFRSSNNQLIDALGKTITPKNSAPEIRQQWVELPKNIKLIMYLISFGKTDYDQLSQILDVKSQFPINSRYYNIPVSTISLNKAVPLRSQDLSGYFKMVNDNALDWQTSIKKNFLGVSLNNKFLQKYTRKSINNQGIEDLKQVIRGVVSSYEIINPQVQNIYDCIELNLKQHLKWSYQLLPDGTCKLIKHLTLDTNDINIAKAIMSSDLSEFIENVYENKKNCLSLGKYFWVGFLSMFTMLCLTVLYTYCLWFVVPWVNLITGEHAKWFFVSMSFIMLIISGYGFYKSYDQDTFKLSVIPSFLLGVLGLSLAAYIGFHPSWWQTTQRVCQSWKDLRLIGSISASLLLSCLTGYIGYRCLHKYDIHSCFKTYCSDSFVDPGLKDLSNNKTDQSEDDMPDKPDQGIALT